MSFPYEVPAADTLSRCQPTENISELKPPQEVESHSGIMKLKPEIKIVFKNTNKSSYIFEPLKTFGFNFELQDSWTQIVLNLTWF